jgi:hypothetical protein
MSSPATRKRMNCSEGIRTIQNGPLTIRLFFAADEQCCSHIQEDNADSVSAAVSVMVIDDDDLPIDVAERIAGLFRGLTAIEVYDEDGDGARLSDPDY